MHLEYDWTLNVYRPRLGTTWTDVDGHRSFPSLADARYVLATCNLMLGRKTDSRTWEITAAPILIRADETERKRDADWRWANDWD
jgi:hypothetical protein